MSSEYQKSHYLKNRERYSRQHSEYYRTHKAETNRRSAENYQKNKAKIALWTRLRKMSNPEHFKEIRDRSYAKNIKSIRRRQSEIQALRYDCDIQYRIMENLRARLGSAIRFSGGQKYASTRELIGCTVDELRAHLEKQFLPGMSWSNRKEWHIDHIRPCASFDLTDPEQQKICFNWKNLQPLWAMDNWKKGSNPSSVDGKTFR